MNELERYNEKTFESIKHVNEYGQEYWLARELQPILFNCSLSERKA